MEQDQYVAGDVHQATTTFVVRDSCGRIVMETVVVTEARRLVSFVRSLSGRVHLTFEEGPCAAWLHDLLRRHVHRLVICNPRRHVRTREEKADRIDAAELSERLRGGFLRPVYHGQRTTRHLKQLVYAYRSLVSDSVRVQNRIGALFRSRGLPTQGTLEALFSERQHLGSAGRVQRVEWLYRELEVLALLRSEARQALEAEARKHQCWHWLRTVPGIGPIRAAMLVARIDTPQRFRTKRQLWKYSGLAVVSFTSNDYVVDEAGLRKRPYRATRGLNRHYSRMLKEVFKSAAVDAAHRGALKAHYDRLLLTGRRASLARLTLARKIAAICLAIWKKGEPYDPAYAMS